jgi:hypothetical protein
MIAKVMASTNQEQASLPRSINDAPVVPIDRSKYSEFALELIDSRGIRDSEDPEAILIGLLDAFRSKILEDLSLRQLDAVSTQMNSAVARAEVEFGQIDSFLKLLQEAIGQQKSLEKRFTRTTDKVLRQNVVSIAINHVIPLVYVIFGVALCFALQKALGRL